MTDEQLDVVTKALRRAWSLGQTYWSQADSESYSQNRKADETQLAFQRLVEDTRAALASDHALACTASNDPIAVPAAPQAEPETFESELRSFAETPEQVAFVEKLLAPQAAPCVGNDPTCPCQDGDACHYKDTDGTKAWPVYNPFLRECTEAEEQAEPKLGELMLEQRRSRVVAGAYPDGNPNAGAMMAQTSQAEPIDPHMIAAEDRFPDDDGPVILGEPDVLAPDDVRRVMRPKAEPPLDPTPVGRSPIDDAMSDRTGLIDPHTIDSKFSEWWQSDKADDATDNPFQPDSAAAWAYAGWMAAQRAEPKRPVIEVRLDPHDGYWRVALCVSVQEFEFADTWGSPGGAESYAKRLRAALEIIGDSNA